MNELEPLIVGGLVVEEPTIQGGVGVGISLYKLAGAVARAGSMGIISAAQIGFKEPGFTTNFVEANVRSIRREMRLAREITPQGAIDFSITVATKHYDMWVKEAVKVGADIIISGAGLPVSLPEYVEAVYTEMKEEPVRRIKLTPIISSAESAMIICEAWDRKCHIVPDLVVVGGPLTGGHPGFSLDQLSAYGADTTDMPTTYDRDAYDQGVEAIMKAVGGYGSKYGKHVPMVAIGGIYTHEDVVHQLELGTDDVQVVTGFVTTEERDAPDAYKQAYINTSKEDVVITQSPIGMSGRAILNPFLSRIKSNSGSAVRPCFQCLKHCDIGTIPCCITMALVSVAEGGTDHDLLLCGDNAYRTEKIDTVDNIMRELTGELA